MKPMMHITSKLQQIVRVGGILKFEGQRDPIKQGLSEILEARNAKENCLANLQAFHELKLYVQNFQSVAKQTLSVIFNLLLNRKRIYEL